MEPAPGRPSLYIIDGHSQIFRAYYAPFGNLTAPSGEPVRATYVFCQMLMNLVRDRRPDYLVVVLDGDEAKLVRRSIYPRYKAQRPPMPEDLPQQERRIISILRALNVPILQVEGHEADDVIGTLVRRLADTDLHIYLVSRDKDLDQLLSDRVWLYDPMKDEVITPEKLREIKGWGPEQAVDAQTLIGDSVDNVPGVPGIGPKTAAKLLGRYGSVQGIIEHADELPPRQRDSLLAFARENLEVTRRLVTLRDDVPLEFDLRSAETSRLDWSKVEPIFVELGFRRLLDQLPRLTGTRPSAPRPASGATGGGGTPAAPGVEPAGTGASGSGRQPATSMGATPQTAEVDDASRNGPWGDAGPAGRTAQPGAQWIRDHSWADHSAGGIVAATPEPGAGRAAAEAARLRERLLARAASLREPQTGRYELVDTPQRLAAFCEALERQSEFAIDTETTLAHPIDADLVGLSFSWEPGRGFYLPVRSIYSGVLPLPAVREQVGPILADPARRKVGHHIKYDLIVLRQAGMPLSGPLFDTMVAAFAIDPSRLTFGLDSLVYSLFGHSMIPLTDLIGKGRDQLRVDQVSPALLAEYSGQDADYTWRLRLLLEPELEPLDLAELFYGTEMPLVNVLTEMEYNGIRIDVDYLRQMSRSLAQRAAQLVEEVHRLTGVQFNLDSPRQLAEVLFDRLGLRVVRRTKTARSTDADTLETLARETRHPVLERLLEYRELQKLRTTYVDALPQARSRRTGRIHTSFNQTGAITGRLSSSDPNLQNIPVRSELGRQIRRAFIPRSPDQVLIVADYSQVELRVLAHFSQDEELIRAFAEDRDIHAFVAAQINRVPLESVTSEMRSRAKAVNFGIIYGQTPHGLAQATGMSRTEAQQFIEAYFQRYRRVRTFIDRCIDDARRQGHVRTILGRRRPIPNIDSRNASIRAQAERLAVNTVIQGSAADLMKRAMVALHERIQREGLPLRILLQVHDELVCEGPRDQAPLLAERIRQEMSGAMPLRVPLKVDLAWGDNWLETG